MTTTEVTSFLSADEPESISFQDSLRFFRQQLLADPPPKMMNAHKCPQRRLIHADDDPSNYASEEGPKFSRISIPTVDSILESVRVLRAIQKSQRGREDVQHPTTGVQELLSRADGVLLNSLQPAESNEDNFSVMEDFLNNSSETSNFWPKNEVDESSGCSDKENDSSCDRLNYFNSVTSLRSRTLSNQVGHITSKDKNWEDTHVPKSSSDIVLRVESGALSDISNEVNGAFSDHGTHIELDNAPAPKELISPLNFQEESDSKPDVSLLENSREGKEFDSFSEERASCESQDPSSGYSSSVFSNQFLKEESLTESRVSDDENHSHAIPESEDSGETPAKDKEEEGEGAPPSSRKFTTSSWDLVSIVKLLFNIEELHSPKMDKCLNSKCESKEESELLNGELHLDRASPEVIHVVRYPIKSHQDVVIVDLGSCSTRAGILMDQPTLPTLFFPSVCATHKTTGEHIFGVDALEPEVRQNAVISFPLRPSAKIIKHSVDVEQVTGIFKKIFKDLRIDPKDYAMLVCLPRNLSIDVQSAIVRVLLEDLGVRAVSLSHQAILTLYAHDVSTGVVLDIGDRMDVLPVVDGFVVDGGVTRLPYGGRRLIHHMKHALAQKHVSLSNDIDSFVVEYISQELSYVADDYEREVSLPPQTLRRAVDLTPFARDETCLKCAVLDEARFKVPEGLFKPDLWGLDSAGVHLLVQRAIQAAGVDSRKRVAENIYVSGGVTLIPGFVERLAREVARLNEPRITPKVHASSHRSHCSFIGGCRVAGMEAFPQVCLTREQYSKDPRASLNKFALCV